MENVPHPCPSYSSGALGQQEELDWELWAHISTRIPRGDYCSTCISMLWCTTDSFLSWQQLLILWPRGFSTLKSQTWGRNCYPRIAAFSLFPLFWVILWSFISSCSSRRSCSGTKRTGWRFPAGTSCLESWLGIVCCPSWLVHGVLMVSFNSCHERKERIFQMSLWSRPWGSLLRSPGMQPG